MEFSDFLMWKFILIVAVVGIVNFLYAAITGRTIEEARRDRLE